LTKLMTMYVTLRAVRAGRVSLDTPLVYTAEAQAQKPSKLGLPVGTVITIDNAIKIMIVRSANDLAVTLAEGVGGSVEAFVSEMNVTAARLGMKQTHFVNPNGWWEPGQVTSARDMAILARTLLREFPQEAYVFKIRSLKLGKRIIRGHNPLLGRFLGADGMKTGFTCPSGLNLVATASRGDRHLIAVVMGHTSGKDRTEEAAELLEQGFGTLTFWRSGQTAESLPPMPGEPPNMRQAACGGKKHLVDEDVEDAVPEPQTVGGLISAFAEEKRPVLLDKPPPSTPVAVFLGPNPAAPAALPAVPGPAYAGNLTSPPAALTASDEGLVPAPVMPMPAPRPTGLKSAKAGK
jgi:D-alanyl-D-alanine carboxypeptidase